MGSTEKYLDLARRLAVAHAALKALDDSEAAPFVATVIERFKLDPSTAATDPARNTRTTPRSTGTGAAAIDVQEKGAVATAVMKAITADAWFPAREIIRQVRRKLPHASAAVVGVNLNRLTASAKLVARQATLKGSARQVNVYALPGTSADAKLVE